MSIGLFTNKSSQPSETQVREAIGPKIKLWDCLIHTMQEQYPVQQDFKFLYGKNYGWAARFRIKGQLLISLFPTQGGFIVQVNLSPDDIEKVLVLKMSKNIQQAIALAHPYPEGRWLFIPVETNQDLNDVQRLAEIRAHTKHMI